MSDGGFRESRPFFLGLQGLNPAPPPATVGFRSGPFAASFLGMAGTSGSTPPVVGTFDHKIMLVTLGRMMR